MSYSNPGGYGGPPQGPSTAGYGPQSAGYGAPPEQGQGRGLPFYLNIGVVVLGVLSFFLGFTPYISGASAEFGGESVSVSSSTNFFMTNGLISTSLLLAAALVAALGMLPKHEIHEGVVASLSVVAFISLLFQLISLPSAAKVGFGLIIVLITSFLQAALAVTALLFSADIIKPPAPKQPQYGYYGQGAYGPQQPLPQGQPQQPYYGAAPGSGPYPQAPPSQPQQPHSQW
ncbi:MAG: DUF5336 domain-containing protein [Mycobacteriaceae bacterium]|nr:DUF5336 domain-containing protein [Mycobacteriaceae bacterium]